MINSIQSNLNFTGAVHIGGKTREDKANTARSISEFGDFAGRNNEKILINALKDFSLNLAKTTDPAKEYSVGFSFYTEGFNQYTMAVHTQELGDEQSKTVLFTKKDLTEEDDKSTGKSKSVPKMICEMFDNASDGITDRLGLDYHTRTKNKHANEVFDIIA